MDVFVILFGMFCFFELFVYVVDKVCGCWRKLVRIFCVLDVRCVGFNFVDGECVGEIVLDGS